MKYVVLVALVALVGQSTSQGEELSQSDRVRIAVQQICPVSGQKLGEHGQPIQAKIGEEVVYLCCQGCIKGKVDPKHWATIHANFAKAQGICPVMKKALPKNPKWTVVAGRIVYVCCPPCTDKIAADHEKYLKAVDQLYVAHLKAQQNPRR